MARFKKGQSGNPKGRPRGKPAIKQGLAVDIIDDRTLTIRKGGKLQDVSVEEALYHQTYLKAIDGDKPARREVLQMIEKWEAYRHKKGQLTQPRLLDIKSEPTDPDNANEAMLILGIASIDDKAQEMNGHQPPLHLEPWVVQAALGRRRGGTKLSKRHVDDIRRCPRNHKEINWPRGTNVE